MQRRGNQELTSTYLAAPHGWLNVDSVKHAYDTFREPSTGPFGAQRDKERDRSANPDRHDPRRGQERTPIDPCATRRKRLSRQLVGDA